jgi:hypothetical protein
MRLFLRLFANCDDAASASLLAGRLMLALHAHEPSEHAEPRQYWKMRELFEFTYTLNPETEESFQAVIASTASGWHQVELGDDELSAIWNRANDHVFLVPEVSWANLELHRT